MNLISTTLIHKIRPPAATGAENPPALVLIHGRGANEDDLLGLADYLDPRFFVISVRAPYRFQEGYDGYTWYGIRDIGTPDRQEFDSSYKAVMQFLEDIKGGYPIDPQRIFLLGFSMGSVMALAAALTVPGAVRGIVAHSGYVPENTSLRFAWERLNGLSIFLAHGTQDPIVGIEFGRRANELLSKTSADFTYREYPIPHTISEESLADLSDWLQKKLAVPADMK